MSELSNKASMKKGFKAPIMKDNVLSQECSSSPEKSKEHKKKKQNKEVKVKNDQKSLKSDIQQTKEQSNKNEDLEQHKDTPNSGSKPSKKGIKKENLEKGEKSARPHDKEIKPQVSLTDSQYEDIFDAVLKDRKSNSGSQQNTPVDELQLQAPREGGSKESSEKSMSEPTTPGHKPVSQATTPARARAPAHPSTKATPQMSPWGSHLSKQASQASSILKEIESESLIGSSSCVASPSPSGSDSGGSDSSVPSVQSQQPSTDQRKLLQELQRCRNVGVWVYCDRMSCQKVRYLPYITDPQELPDVWYCHMNKDPKFNNCQCEEQPPSPEEEEDMIYNSYTAGSVVWARVPGYPWWPALVDDDPDLAQYYWLLDDFFTVTHYHVVFFDEGPVTRAWVDLKHISPYTKQDNKYKQTVCRGIDFTHRIRVAREQANDALTLTSYRRLTVYSFIARYTGPISTSNQKKKNVMKNYKLKSTKEKNVMKKNKLESKEDKKKGYNRKVKDVQQLSTKKGNPKEKPIKNKRQITESSPVNKYAKKQKVDSDTRMEEKEAYEAKRKGVKEASEVSEDTCTKVPEVDMDTTYMSSLQQDSQDVGSNANNEPGPSEQNVQDKVEGEVLGETASYIEGTQPELSQGDSIGSVVEPSDECCRAESEDGVVPYSQQSLPFEE